VEADIAMSSVDIEVLMASYVEDNTSQGKSCIFDSISTVHDVPIRRCSILWLQKELSMAQLAKSSALGQSMLHAEIGRCMLWRRSSMSRRHGTI